MGQSIERMKKGYSKIWNEAIANVFLYMTQKKLAVALNISESSVKRLLAKSQAERKISREGNRRSGLSCKLHDIHRYFDRG